MERDEFKYGGWNEHIFGFTYNKIKFIFDCEDNNNRIFREIYLKS